MFVGMYVVDLCDYVILCFFFKQKTAYELRISDWSSDVCSSDLAQPLPPTAHRRFGQCDPFVSFPRGEVGRGHVADKGEAESALRLDCREILRTRRFGEISHPPPKIKFEAGNAHADGISCAGCGSNHGDASDSAWREAACDLGGGAERRQEPEERRVGKGGGRTGKFR